MSKRGLGVFDNRSAKNLRPRIVAWLVSISIPYDVPPDPGGNDLLLESSGAPVSEFDEIKVPDDAGSAVHDSDAGELVTRGPYTIRGYYNAEAINADAFTADGFYRMGDIVRKRGRYVTQKVEGRI